MTKYGGEDFLERMNFLDSNRKEKLENLKMKSRLQKDLSDYTFHPKIDNKQKDLKRGTKDLYVIIKSF